jgi:hypothetical protein
MSNTQLQNSTLVNQDEITWSGDGKYIETLTVKKITSQPETVEITVRTQFLTAKNPTEWRVKSQIFLQRNKLKELHELIGRVLVDSSGSSDEMTSVQI